MKAISQRISDLRSPAGLHKAWRAKSLQTSPRELQRDLFPPPATQVKPVQIEIERKLVAANPRKRPVVGGNIEAVKNIHHTEKADADFRRNDKIVVVFVEQVFCLEAERQHASIDFVSGFEAENVIRVCIF